MKKPFVETSVVRADIGTFSRHQPTAPTFELQPKKTAAPSVSAKAARDYAAQMRSQDRNASAAAQTALLSEMRLAVATLGRKEGLTEDQIDDAIGDSMVEMADYLNKGKSIHQGLIQMRAITIVHQYVNGHVRHETVRGMKLLETQQIAEEIRVNRLLTTGEVSALAARIRENWPEKYHRPALGFEKPGFFDPHDDVDFEQLAELEAAGRISPDAIPRPYAHVSLDFDRVVEGFGRPALRKRMYDLYATAEGLPPAQTKTIPELIATRMSGAVLGRVAQVARTFLADGVEGRDSAALFAPFGRLIPSQKEELAESFAGQAEMADHFWKAALGTATLTDADARRQARLAKSKQRRR